MHQQKQKHQHDQHYQPSQEPTPELGDRDIIVQHRLHGILLGRNKLVQEHHLVNRVVEAPNLGIGALNVNKVEAPSVLEASPGTCRLARPWGRR